MEIKKIYFDMDDTIAAFSQGLIDLCGIRLDKPVHSGTEADEAMWCAIRSTAHFYYLLQECEPGASLFRKLRTLYGDKVEILTAIPKRKRNIIGADEDKKRWMADHFGPDVVVNIAPSRQEKQLYVKGPDCFLIDDLSENVAAWRTAGGTGILFQRNNAAATAKELAESGLLSTEHSAE